MDISQAWAEEQVCPECGGGTVGMGYDTVTVDLHFVLGGSVPVLLFCEQDHEWTAQYTPQEDKKA